MSVVRRILVYLSFIAPLIGSAQLNISVYRNDGVFNNVRLFHGDSIPHLGLTEEPYISVNDFIEGHVDIPLALIDSMVVHSSDIPVLRFSLPDYPDAEMLWEKELYVDANLSIEGFGYCDDQQELKLQMKGRGNSTWSMPKKPMRLKFSKKTSICGFKKAKSYVLLNNYIDPSMMRNSLAMWFAKRIGIPFSNTIVPCHVFINGCYAGAYALTEKIGINGASVDIDENQGILFEMDVAYDEKYKFTTPILQQPVMVKDPDFDELFEDDPEGKTPEMRLAEWEEDFIKAEQLACDGNGAEAFDLESVVNYVLVNYLMANPELDAPKSVYLYKRSLEEDEKYYLGPVWDFDVSCNFKQIKGDSIWVQSPTTRIAAPKIIREIIKTEEFQQEYRKKIDLLVEEIIPEFWEFFESYAQLISLSGVLNGKRWAEEYSIGDWMLVESSANREKSVSELREWMKQRIEYILSSPPKY